jgi:hypothetical protein
MNVGLKNAHRNHSQVGLKQDYSQSFVGIKKDLSIKASPPLVKENSKNVKHSDNSQGIVNDYGKNREPLGLYSTSSNQPKPVVQSNIERKKKRDKNGYNVDKNYVN